MPYTLSIRTIVFAAGALAVSILPLMLAGALAVQIQADLAFDSSGMGAVFSLFYIVAAVSSPFMGGWSERLGPRAALRLATAAAGLLLLGVAAAGRSWLALALGVALAGATLSMVHAASNLYIARAIPMRRMGLSLGIKQCGIPIATLLGGLAVPTLAITVGWRWAFVVGGVLAFMASVWAPSIPSSQSWPDASASPPVIVLRQSHLNLLSVGLGFAMAGTSSIGALTVVTMVQSGVSEAGAGLAFAVASLGGIGARVVMGVVADLHPGRDLMYVAVMLLGGAVSYGLFATGASMLMYPAVGLALASGWGWLGLFDLSIVRRNPATPGKATGIAKTGGFVGSAVGPPLLGGLAVARSFSMAWAAAAVWALVAAACLLAVARSSRQ